MPIAKNFSIDSGKALIVAEVAQSHDGSVGIAHSFIDAIADAGADAVKFQTHVAEAESTLDEPFRVRFSTQDASRYDYWKRMEFSKEQWADLAEHARDSGLYFLSSPFSAEAVALLGELQVAAWKLGSGEVLSMDLFEPVLDEGGILLISTGMSRWEEIDQVVELMRSRSAEFVLMQCTSKYPAGLEDVGLNVLHEMKERYECPVGLSDHTGTPWPSLAALARGASVIEVHATFDRRMFGPDVGASITFSELELLVKARDAIAAMDAHPVSKNSMADELASTRAIFGKSVALRRPLRAGATIGWDDITLKKPGTGIPAAERELVVGRRLVNDVDPDRLLTWEDIYE